MGIGRKPQGWITMDEDINNEIYPAWFKRLQFANLKPWPSRHGGFTWIYQFFKHGWIFQFVFCKRLESRVQPTNKPLGRLGVCDLHWGLVGIGDDQSEDNPPVEVAFSWFITPMSLWFMVMVRK